MPSAARSYLPIFAAPHPRTCSAPLGPVSALRSADRHDPVAWARSLYRDDEVTPALLQRAAVDAAVTSVPAWAGILSQRQVVPWLGSLAPASAAAALISRGITVRVGNGIPLGVPVRATPPTAAPYVDETGAIPVRAWSLATADLNPAKLGILIVLSKELASNSDASAIFDAMLREEAAMLAQLHKLERDYEARYVELEAKYEALERHCAAELAALRDRINRALAAYGLQPPQDEARDAALRRAVVKLW